ncbi:hypothetical protein APSETT445_009562 [Aspergillus pseudonomiae]
MAGLVALLESALTKGRSHDLDVALKTEYLQSLNKGTSIWDTIPPERRGQAAEFQEAGNMKVQDWNQHYAEASRS